MSVMNSSGYRLLKVSKRSESATELLHDRWLMNIATPTGQIRPLLLPYTKNADGDRTGFRHS